MVIQDLYGVFGSFQNMSPLFSLDDGQEFFVMYLVVPLALERLLDVNPLVPFVVLAQLG